MKKSNKSINGRKTMSHHVLCIYCCKTLMFELDVNERIKGDMQSLTADSESAECFMVIYFCLEHNHSETTVSANNILFPLSLPLSLCSQLACTHSLFLVGKVITKPNFAYNVLMLMLRLNSNSTGVTQKVPYFVNEALHKVAVVPASVFVPSAMFSPADSALIFPEPLKSTTTGAGTFFTPATIVQELHLVPGSSR